MSPTPIRAPIRVSDFFSYRGDELHAEEIAVSRALLAAHVEEFLKWYAARDVGPVVKALYERCHALARGELEALLSRRPQMSAEERAELERLTHRLVGKILHEPVTQLTTHAEATARPMLTAALSKLFALDHEAGDPAKRD